MCKVSAVIQWTVRILPFLLSMGSTVKVIGPMQLQEEISDALYIESNVKI